MSKNKVRYKPKDWKSYNQALCQRGSITLWLSDEVLRQWDDLATRPIVVGQCRYPEAIIRTALIIRSVFRLPLRQSTGFLRSILTLMGKPDLPVPDYSTLSRRASDLSVDLSSRLSDQPIHIAVDSTGLKVYGEGEWKVRKHGVSKRRTWRKLHIGIDVETQQIVCSALTDNSVDDAEMTEKLLDPFEGSIDAFYGDGAYDKKKSRRVVHQAGGKIIVPPPKNAVIHEKAPPELTSRNEAVKRIGEIGRAAWKKEVGYHRRSLAEVAMHRYKGLIGSTLRARKFDNQVGEVKIGCHILNVFNRCGMPNARPV